MLDAVQRAQLREQAIVAWECAKRLQCDGPERLCASGDLLEWTGQHHARSTKARAISSSSPPLVQRPEDVPSAQCPTGTAILHALVDQAIRRWGPIEKDVMADGSGTGLAASVNLPILVRLQETLGRRLGNVVGANDAGTALGLAIATQPDVSLIDARLDLASGSDLAIVLARYAPQTKTLLLTDDELTMNRALSVGIDVLSRDCSEERLLAWIADTSGKDT